MRNVKSVEEFLIEKLNAKYASRIFSKINTEFEDRITKGLTEPGPEEYEWMVSRVRAVHKDFMKDAEKEKPDAKETKD